jgi:hypothetical protein
VSSAKFVSLNADVGHTRRDRRGDTVTGKAIQDLVGRVMIDRQFLEGLVRNPEQVLADYDLSPDERAIIMQALGRSVHVSEDQRADALQIVLLKRWAT